MMIANAPAPGDSVQSREDPPILLVSDLCRAFPVGEQTVEVLRGVSFSAHPAESVAILGPSGSGKSTLLNLIGLLDRPDAGSIRFGSTELTGLSEAEAAVFRRDNVGFVFQEHHLLPQCSALENVLTPLLADASVVRDARPGLELLERVGLADKADSMPDELSGGERQRVAIARALVRNPQMLLCDEPTGNLDRNTGLQVVRLFLELVREQKMLVIMVTHNEEVAGLLDRRLHLRDGKLVEQTH